MKKLLITLTMVSTAMMAQETAQEQAINVLVIINGLLVWMKKSTPQPPKSSS